MGGNAFPNLKNRMVRIRREEIAPLVRRIADRLSITNLTVDYLSENMMGSAGKQPSSGDLDFAINTYRAQFVGEPELPVFNLRQIAARCREVLPPGHVDTKNLPGEGFNTLWEISEGLIQVDFVGGKPDWLKFAHWSPGADVSPYKGLMLMTMLGVLAKVQLDWELRDASNERIARIGLNFNLERGLTRTWAYQLRPGQNVGNCDADTFETHVQAPRFTRLGFISDPAAVLRILFRHPTTHDEVNTFEKMLAYMRKHMSQETYAEAKSRFLFQFAKLAARNGYDINTIENDPVWAC